MKVSIVNRVCAVLENEVDTDRFYLMVKSRYGGKWFLFLLSESVIKWFRLNLSLTRKQVLYSVNTLIKRGVLTKIGKRSYRFTSPKSEVSPL